MLQPRGVDTVNARMNSPPLSGIIDPKRGELGMGKPKDAPQRLEG